MTLSESETWVATHSGNIAKAFKQKIEADRLRFFAAYDTLEEMREDFSEYADEAQPNVKKVLDKWIIQYA